MLSIILQSIIAIFIPVVSTFAIALLNKGLNILNRKYDLDITEAQKDVIRGAVTTGSGLIQSAVAAKQLRVENVNADNSLVQAIAAKAMVNVQESAQALTVSPAVATNMMVAQFHTNTPSPIGKVLT